MIDTDITKYKTQGVIQSSNKTKEWTNLYKLKKEIDKTKELRNDILNIFQQDSINSIKNINYKYLENVPFPLLIDYHSLFDNDKLKIKLFTKDCLYSDFKVPDTNNLKEEILNNIDKYVEGLLRVKKETNILDNSFYLELEVLIYNNYIKKLIISGDGIRLANDSYLNYELKREIIYFYYKNLKKILKNIQVEEVIELEKYRSNITKQKVLEIYRG